MKPLLVLPLALVAYCRSAPVDLNDNRVEPIFENILRESRIKKRFSEIDFTQKKFSIDELFLISLDRTEQMAINAERTFVADATVRQRIGAWLPRVSGNAASYAPFAPGYVVSGLRFSARQNIMTGLTEYTGIVGARLQRIAEDHSLRADLSAHMLNIADAALQLYLGDTLKAIAAEMVRVTESSLAEIRRRARLGRNKSGDVLKTEAKLKQKQADLVAADEKRWQLLRSLRFLTGINDDFVVVPSTEQFSLGGEELHNLDITLRPDIALGITMVAVRKNEVTAAYGGHIPNLYIDSSFRPALESVQQQSYFAGLVAEIPIFAGGQIVESQNIANSHLRQAELELRQAQRKANIEIEDARDTFLKAGAEREAYAASATASEKNYRTQLNDLRLSLGTMLDVLQAQEDWQLARIAEANARYREGIARVRFFVATGKLFPRKLN
ncbi:MAG: TolC family protein [Spirochaetes bacterium]|nr:TolC family protein [Spirochaetota bacterium]